MRLREYVLAAAPATRTVQRHKQAPRFCAQLVCAVEQRRRAFHNLFITAHRPRPLLPENNPPKSPRFGSGPGSGASVTGSGAYSPYLPCLETGRQGRKHGPQPPLGAGLLPVEIIMASKREKLARQRLGAPKRRRRSDRLALHVNLVRPVLWREAPAGKRNIHPVLLVPFPVEPVLKAAPSTPRQEIFTFNSMIPPNNQT